MSHRLIGEYWRPGSVAPKGTDRAGLAIWSQLFLRIASSAGVLVLGAYFVSLRDRGGGINSLLLGGVSGLVYLTEVLLAPVGGWLGDRRGRKRFLLAGPVLSALAVLLIPLGVGTVALLPLGIILGLVGVARLVEGASMALSVPATLGLLAEATDVQPVRRGRLASFFELASSVGIAAGAVAGPVLWQLFHLFAFVLLAGVYLIAALFVLGVEDRPRNEVRAGAFSLRRYVVILSHRPLARFIPMWILVNAILGVWVGAQVEFVLAARIHVPDQHFVGSLYGHPGTLSEILGAYLLWFALCITIWARVVGRLPRFPTLLITVAGAIPASAGLIALNHGAAPIVFLPIFLAGVFLEAGFTPAALAYLADISQRFSQDRGSLMGLYSTMLGVGQLGGTVLGGLCAQIAYFDGLAYLTIGLAVAALAVSALPMGMQRGWARL